MSITTAFEVKTHSSKRRLMMPEFGVWIAIGTLSYMPPICITYEVARGLSAVAGVAAFAYCCA